ERLERVLTSRTTVLVQRHDYLLRSPTLIDFTGPEKNLSLDIRQAALTMTGNLLQDGVELRFQLFVDVTCQRGSADRDRLRRLLAIDTQSRPSPFLLPVLQARDPSRKTPLSFVVKKGEGRPGQVNRDGDLVPGIRVH